MLVSILSTPPSISLSRTSISTAERYEYQIENRLSFIVPVLVMKKEERDEKELLTNKIVVTLEKYHGIMKSKCGSLSVPSLKFPPSWFSPYPSMTHTG